ncbi:MAG TPA: AAA family ATPase, partial [bacterium]|nr:AAA family ATPase [bacterium]
FLGPTGVGKTATAKALAKVYFGAESAMVRFDMSEYQNKNDLYRLIGYPQGQQGVLSTAVREHPFSLVLFDEIEKAHPDILNIFLQILDEGRLTDSNGEVVSFVNTIIISTSNAGAAMIHEGVSKKIPYVDLKMQLTEALINSGTYKPEFLNRFTSVVLFSSLSAVEIESIASLMVAKVAGIIKENQGIALTVTPEAIKKLALAGFDPTMGARPLERTIQDKVESLIARMILEGKLKKGDSFTIDGSLIS